jgi:hypothetical protein
MLRIMHRMMSVEMLPLNDPVQRLPFPLRPPSLLSPSFKPIRHHQPTIGFKPV